MQSALTSAEAYSSAVEARYPVACPWTGAMMSAAGPPLLFATAITPLAMYSTTPMPKCSSTMVWIPTTALESRSLILE